MLVPVPSLLPTPPADSDMNIKNQDTLIRLDDKVLAAGFATLQAALGGDQTTAVSAAVTNRTQKSPEPVKDMPFTIQVMQETFKIIYSGPVTSYSGNLLPHGEGSCTFSDGKSYTGDWMNGHMYGRGTLTAANGTVEYTGTWSNSVKMGNGFENTNVDGYDGDFKNNLREGSGTRIKINSKTGQNEVVYDGEWVGGQPLSPTKPLSASMESE